MDWPAQASENHANAAAKALAASYSGRRPSGCVGRGAANVVNFADPTERSPRRAFMQRMQTRERLIERNVSPADQSDLSPLGLPRSSGSRLNGAGSIMGQRGAE